MGSFCVQCCASQQIISDDEKCVILPIRQERTYAAAEVVVDGREPQFHFGSAFSGCNPGSHWAAHGGFITATYADYGSFALEDTATNRQVLASFFRDLLSDRLTVREGENPSHDVPFDLMTHAKDRAPVFVAALSAPHGSDALVMAPFEEFEALWEHVAEAVRKRRAFVLDNSCIVRPLEFAVLHRAAFDELVAMGEAHVGYRKESYARVPLVARLFEGLNTKLDETLLETAPERVDSVNWFYARQLFEALRRNPPVELSPLFVPHETMLDNFVHGLFKGTVSLEAFVEAAKPVLDAGYVASTLEELNLRFSPVAYGGQDYSNETGQAYAGFIARTSAAVTQQVAELRGD